ncbi:MAG: hypothetical protein Q9193_004053 [Seirophora villosa]
MAPLSDDYTLTVRQGPERAKLASVKEKERKPVDPPPIVQLYIKDPADPAQNYLQSPYLFMCVNLCEAEPAETEPLASQGVLSGTLVSSLHRLKDIDNTGRYPLPFLLPPTDQGFRRRILRVRRLIRQDRRELSSSLQFVRDGQVSPSSTSKHAPLLKEPLKGRSGVYQIRAFSTLYRKRTAPGLRSDDIPLSFEDSSPSSYRSATLHSQRSSMGVFNYRHSGMGEPSPKRARLSEDLSERNFYDPERYVQRPYMDQRAPYGGYSARDQTSSVFQSAYSQGPQSAMGNASDYSLGHQRTNSSSTSSPYVSPHTEVSGQSWPAPNMYYQSPMKEASYPYAPPQYPDMQFGRHNQHQLGDPFQRQRTTTMPSSNLPSQNVPSQNMASRLPVAMNFQYPRTQEGESSAVGMYGHNSRSLPSTASLPDPSPRLPSTDQLTEYTSSNRQQYQNTQVSNILPPIDVNFGSNQLTRENSHQVTNTVLPSIEPHTMVTNPSQPVSDHGQDAYDGQANYDEAFNYPLQSQKTLNDS